MSFLLLPTDFGSRDWQVLGGAAFGVVQDSVLRICLFCCCLRILVVVVRRNSQTKDAASGLLLYESKTELSNH